MKMVISVNITTNLGFAMRASPKSLTNYMAVSATQELRHRALPVISIAGHRTRGQALPQPGPQMMRRGVIRISYAFAKANGVVVTALEQSHANVPVRDCALTHTHHAENTNTFSIGILGLT